MSLLIGIYGYPLSHPTAIKGILRIVPRPLADNEARQLAKDSKQYHLLGCAELDPSLTDPHRLAFDLSGILTFAQQADVIVTRPIVPSDSTLPDDVFAGTAFPLAFDVGWDRAGSGPIIPRDDMWPEATGAWISTMLRALHDTALNEATGFAGGFWRAVEVHRSRTLDAKFFFAFTALERIGRCLSSSKQVRLLGALKALEKETKIGVDEGQLKAWVSWRNALFHSGDFGSDAVECYSDLERYVSAAVLKVSGFQHPAIAWDRWKTRIPFR